MKESRLKLIEKEDLYTGGKLWRLRFDAPCIEADPGQFVNIMVEGKYLRRPISVSEYEGGVLTLIIDKVGEGTARIIETPVGGELDMLTGLGNRFSLHPEIEGKNVLLLGGGVGYAPLVGLLKRLLKETDLKPFAVFGFNGRKDVPYHHLMEMMEAGLPIAYCTMTGEIGEKGNVIEVAKRCLREWTVEPAYFYTCGPMVMMNAVKDSFPIPGEMSLEARMGCGFGACMGCSVESPEGIKRICREGPVFKVGG